MQLDRLLQPQAAVWIVAPHADDEALGCGGLIAAARRLNVNVYVLFLTLSGYVPLDAGKSSSHSERRAEMEGAMACARVKGFDVLFDNGKHHCYLDTVPVKDMLDWLESGSRYSFRTLLPQLLLVPCGGHSHQDHRRVSETVAALTRVSPLPNGTDRVVLEYEIPGMSAPGAPAFEPNIFLELPEEDLTAKCALFEHYRTQLAPAPHPRSAHAIRALAMHRGVEAGYAYAEAYHLVRACLSTK